MPVWVAAYRLRAWHALAFLILVSFVYLCWTGYRWADRYLHERTIAALSWLLANKTIVVDPGHGGKDSGARAPDGTFEKDITLPIALKLADYLRQGGARVIMTRTEDKRIIERQRADLAERARIANEADTDLLISIHCNNFHNSSERGAQTFSQPGAEASRRASRAIQAELIRVLGNTKRVPKEIDYFITREARVPAVIVETGYLSNPAERRLLKDPEYQAKVALAIYAGVVTYFAQEAMPATKWIDDKIIETFQQRPAPLEAP
ncbi:N-acetylmuramoyl-L-alanine amidase family protein [Desulforudis sp. 1088]|uniref:N-acetylmuramoyl-L-alanine amidase family protein n=1 Tax=unclassified Candidatus Desulforudis TaxID=2635950 RepID=UPI003488D688